MSEKERRNKGELYNPLLDHELYRELIRAKELCHEYNTLSPSDTGRKRELIQKIVGSMGKDCFVMAPFWCDYGYNIKMGDHFYANHNCVILDGARVTFGNHVYVGPDCGFYTAGHPLDVRRRNADLEYARPITVGDNVWIGGGVRIMPGVTIGNNTVIGGGSVVVSDIPDGVVAAGNPCQVIRQLDPGETETEDSQTSGSLPDPGERDIPDTSAAESFGTNSATLSDPGEGDIPDTLLGNPGKPEGEAGAAMLSRMNTSHGPVTEWALSFIDPAGAERILDIGCGGGATIGRLAKLAPQARITGLDHSPVSVRESRVFNRELIEAGRAEVLEASVEDLPFPDNSFDRITTVESFYFWPDPQENLKEVRRILKPGGRFYLIADIYGKAGLDQAALENIELYDLFNPSKEEFHILFRNAGFMAVKIHVKEGTDWICVEGIK